MTTQSLVDQRRSWAALLGAYVTISFISAGLVFLVQPMATRLLLPRFGGSAAVWNTAMVVFQSLLLGGYLFAHAMVRLAPGMRRLIQLKSEFGRGATTKRWATGSVRPYR